MMSSDEDFFAQRKLKMPRASEVKRYFGLRPRIHYLTIANSPPASLARYITPQDTKDEIKKVMEEIYARRNQPNALRAYKVDALQQATMRLRKWRESTEREAAAARAAARGMRRKERAYKRMLPQARRGFLEARRGNSVLRYVNCSLRSQPPRGPALRP